MAKRLAEAAKKGEYNPFGGYTANNTHDQMRHRGNAASTVPSTLPNQMLDSLEGYLENISAAATQLVTKEGPIVEL